MKLRPVKGREFLKWFHGRLCQHMPDNLLLSGDIVLCRACRQRFVITEIQFAQYASQFMTCTENE